MRKMKKDTIFSECAGRIRDGQCIALAETWCNGPVALQPKKAKGRSLKAQRAPLAPGDRLVLRFLSARCRRARGARMGATELYKEFHAWAVAKVSPWHVPSQKGFGEALARLGFEKAKSKGLMSYYHIETVGAEAGRSSPELGADSNQ